MQNVSDRRSFLRFLAGSPLVAGAGAWQAPTNGTIASAKDALNVMDFEAAARQTIPPAHFGFLTTGVDDDGTLRANRDGFRHIQLRPKRMVDVTHADLRTEILGAALDHPIALAPVASQKAFHPEGELAVARAVRSKRALQILSTVTTCGVEEGMAAAGRPIWYQLYATSRWEVTAKLVGRAEAAGCPVLVLTVDLPVGRNTETQQRLARTDSRKCSLCHPAEAGAYFHRKPMFEGIDMTGVTINNPGMTWDFVRKLKALTKMKLLLKGIETREDAKLSIEHGADGIIISNHGGRAEDSLRGTIECLPEVVDAVEDRIPVLIDGGFRRGTDIFKALALGAKAVCIGRPYLWGLGAFGEAGVERVIELLRAELELVMKQCGARSIPEIARSMVAFNPRP